ncbi:MAG TPA: hypothetical protein VGB17_08490 [Pyrinomonadaceae bacterium]|jgi:hypothetical protein
MHIFCTSPVRSRYSFIKRLPLSALCLLALTLSAALIPAGGQDKRYRLHRYLIPQGYVGWVRIDFNVKEAPPLPLEDGYYIVRVPPTGYLQTSSDDQINLLYTEYDYVCGGAKYRLAVNTGLAECRVWQEFSGYIGGYQMPEPSPKYRYLFVGLKDEYLKERYTGDNRHKIDLREDGYPRTGSKSNLICQKD